ncbi:MAG: VCBS repeat-containing protein [Bacteroidota bacterium]
MKKKIIYLGFLIGLVFSTCNLPEQEPKDVEELYVAYCGSCHLKPDPANIPKSIWEDHVLPEMGARLGYKYNGYNPFSGNTMKENLYIRMTGTYPKEPVIDSASWQLIQQYILDAAPENIFPDTLRNTRNYKLSQFQPQLISLDENKLVSVMSVQFDSAASQFVIGDVYGSFHQWPRRFNSSMNFNSPVISSLNKKSGLYTTEIGYMNPSEIPLGVVHKKNNGNVDTLAKQLHRPVFTEIIDLDEDGEEEILLCEFGNLTGELSMLVKENGQFEKKTLLPLPGTITLQVTDMDGDGKKDIIVLASQGKEGVYILYQKNNLQFKTEQAISMGSEYGTSWFELTDYNQDGHLDILLANGDNADYSVFLKPFHGVRLFLNNGKNEFFQKWFYPIYGATRVLCNDYDLDGDVDIAVMAFFPDFENAQEESFVYLENKNSAEYIFKPYVFDQAKSGRWMVMEQGDYDGDGDVDIMLGSFLLPINRKKYKSVIDRWRNDRVDVLLLENLIN